MKKILAIGALMGTAVGAFAQGQVLFDNNYNGNDVFMQGSTAVAANPVGYTGNPNGGTWHVALLYSSTSGGGLAQSSLTEVADYIPTKANTDAPGYFADPTVVNLPGAFVASGTFEVVSWIGSDTTWTQVLADNGANETYMTQGANLVEFTDGDIANSQSTPTPGIPYSINKPGNGWDGNLTLTQVTVPEPTTIALGGLGAAALLLFRRRK